MHSTLVIWAFAVHIANSLSDGNTPEAVVIPASQYFEGNDGPWSTFDLRVGTPEQNVRVLVSTASPESMVVLSEYGCSTTVFSTMPPDCAVSRGNLFNVNKSSSWIDMGTYGINQNGVGLEANLGYNQRAQFGLERMGIGLIGPSLSNQTVAGIATPKPFYLGILGLNNQPVNFTSLGNYSSPSLLTTLKEENKIPSLSWSYTAGANYRLKQVYGQLIFSGYDTSRFKENSVSFTMADDITRDLVVVLQSISYSGSSSATLLSDAIDIVIDSTDSNIWLPGDACDAFEKAFDLTFDGKSGLYLVNETHHNTLLNSNAEVSFRLSDVKSGGDTVVIILPYAAFDLTAEPPLVDNSSHYFPLKRANSSTQYTLGRTFLQEAYLSANYESKEFNVSACVWNEGAEENIVTLTSKDSNSSPSGGQSPPGNTRGKQLSGGAIAGIVVACVAVLIVLVVAVTVVILRKRRKWMKAGFAVPSTKPEVDESFLKGPVLNSTPRSMAENSAPLSAADISASRSTAEFSRSAVGSLLMPTTIGETSDGTSTPELDGCDTHIKSNTELDGKEVQIDKPINLDANNPNVYELQGSEVACDNIRGEDSDKSSFTQGTLPSRREGDNDPHPSPLVSPTSTIWRREKRADSSHVVSPTTPTHNISRPF
ncbi:hypothetical protein V490_07044 [Pseudogymnoascus sp. VKM F-3557]|nr:hypothetical protein V490_07044 [Pseudogymnoascus sp. VKM F-3557]